MKKIYTFLLSLFATASPALVLAREGQLPTVNGIESSKGVLAAVDSLTDWIFSGFLMIAVVMILWAAFGFLTSQGNAEKFDAAKKSILYAAIAVAIAVLAKSIVIIAASLVGGSVTYQ